MTLSPDFPVLNKFPFPRNRSPDFPELIAGCYLARHIRVYAPGRVSVRPPFRHPELAAPFPLILNLLKDAGLPGRPVSIPPPFCHP